jgi:phosphatidylglycerol:prolipoprotein diacylglycerol transferase
MMHLFGAFYWNPDPVAFTVPGIALQVRWYGIFWALGFIIGYFLVCRRLSKFFFSKGQKDFNELGGMATDKLTLYIVLGAILGARLGHVFFYDWPYYGQHPLEILNLREGGLASHGGAIGVLLSLLLFHNSQKKHFPGLTLFNLFDLLVAPTALVACFIRFGNFMNQEIVGIPTDLPWAVLFMHPMETALIVPRHPVQLYEAATYFFTFLSLLKLQKKPRPEGFLTGVFFLLVFGSRIFWEFLKESQGGLFGDAILETGQLLSLPFIAIGLFLVIRKSTSFSY